jgi:hypothetical protein
MLLVLVQMLMQQLQRLRQGLLQQKPERPLLVHWRQIHRQTPQLPAH